MINGLCVIYRNTPEDSTVDTLTNRTKYMRCIRYTDLLEGKENWPPYPPPYFPPSIPD